LRNARNKANGFLKIFIEISILKYKMLKAASRKKKGLGNDGGA
jgi:hypothetical protein